ncbi:MAG: hypothetical protein ACYST2_05205 [Planctomycetota bacterium]|jgi:tellurite resistance protein
MVVSELTQEEKKSALMNAAMIMLTDGKAKPEELQVLYQVAKRVGITQQQIEDILQDSTQVKFVAPESSKEKVSQLIDMIIMMSVDGDIEPSEKNLCLTYAAGLGFNTTKVIDFLNSITEKIEKGGQFTRRDLALELEDMLLQQ